MHGLETILLALVPGSALWTDDLVLAESAKSEFGLERVWTQAGVEALAARGLLDRDLADEAHAKLVGFGYQSTHFTGAVLVAALRVSNGGIGAFPMRQIIRAFGQIVPEDRLIALQQLAVFIQRLYLEPMLPETKCVATRALLDTFSDDPQTVTQPCCVPVSVRGGDESSPIRAGKLSRLL
jgi:hypothetical protein